MRKTSACKTTDTYFTTPLAKNKETRLKRGSETNQCRHIHCSTSVFPFFSFHSSVWESKSIREELSLKSGIGRLQVVSLSTLVCTAALLLEQHGQRKGHLLTSASLPKQWGLQPLSVWSHLCEPCWVHSEKQLRDTFPSQALVFFL